jgi:hypothetical protein
MKYQYYRELLQVFVCYDGNKCVLHLKCYIAGVIYKTHLRL